MRALRNIAAVLAALLHSGRAAPLSEHFGKDDVTAYAAAAKAALSSPSTSLGDRVHSIRLLQLMGLELPKGLPGGPACKAAKDALQGPGSLADLHFAAELAKGIGCVKAEPSPTALALVQRGGESQQLLDFYHAALAAEALGEALDMPLVLEKAAALVDDGGLARSSPDKEDASGANTLLVADLLARLGHRAGPAATSTVRAAVVRMAEALPGGGRSDDAAAEPDRPDAAAVAAIFTAAAPATLLAPLNAAAGQLVPVRARRLKAVASQLLAARHSRDAAAMADVYAALREVVAYDKSPRCVVLEPPAVGVDGLAAGTVTLKVLDLFGGPVTVISPVLAALKAANGDDALAAEAPLRADGSGSGWAVGAADIAPGTYQAEFRLLLSGADGDKPTVAHLPLTVTTTARVDGASVIVSPSSSSDAAGARTFAAPLSAGVAAADAASGEYVHVCFALTTAHGSFNPHQSFVRFAHAETGLDVYFVASTRGAGGGGQRCAAVNLAREMGTFLQRSGAYKVSVLVGDPAIDPPVRADLGRIELRFPPAPVPQWPLYTKPLLYESDTTLEALPEKHHTFRRPESRPPAAVSGLFTLVVLAPLAVFAAALGWLGGNLRRLPSGAGFAYCMSYQACIGAVLGLFIWYWISLTMIETLTMLTPLLLATGLLGRKALMGLAHEDGIGGGSGAASKPKDD